MVERASEEFLPLFPPLSQLGTEKKKKKKQTKNKQFLHQDKTVYLNSEKRRTLEIYRVYMNADCNNWLELGLFLSIPFSVCYLQKQSASVIRLLQTAERNVLNTGPVLECR